MNARFTILLPIVVIAAAFMAAGCGGGSGDSSAAVVLPAKKYTTKADLICANAGFEQGSKAGAYLEKHPNATEVELVMPAGVPPLEKMISELHELGLPQGHEKEAEVFLKEAEKALARLKKKPSGALSQEHNPFHKSNELGEKLGLGDCARNP